MVDSPDEPNTVVDNWWTASTETSPALYLRHLATQVSVNLMIAVSHWSVHMSVIHQQESHCNHLTNRQAG